MRELIRQEREDTVKEGYILSAFINGIRRPQEEAREMGGCDFSARGN